MPNISEESLRLLNNQIKNELYNSAVYRYMGSYLKRMGLDNIGDHFLTHQVQEEIGHSQKITDYINDRNETVLSLPIPDASVNITSLTQFAELYLEREQITTEQLKVITQQALTEGDFMLYKFMLDMVALQQEEESTAITYLDRAKMADNDIKTYLIWNSNFSI